MEIKDSLKIFLVNWKCFRFDYNFWSYQTPKNKDHKTFYLKQIEPKWNDIVRDLFDISTRLISGSSVSSSPSQTWH